MKKKFTEVASSGKWPDRGRLTRQFDGDYARAGAVITLVYAVGLGLIWLAPETKGRPLPE